MNFTVIVDEDFNFLLNSTCKIYILYMLNIYTR